MADRLVGKLNERYLNTCILIIRILPEAGLGVNEVISQTSIKDRTHIIDAIKVLEKAKFLTKHKAPIGKLRNLKLTDLGADVKSYLDNIEKYAHSYTNLIEKFDEIDAAIDIKLTKKFIEYDKGVEVREGEINFDEYLRRGGRKRWWAGLLYLRQVSYRDAIFSSLYRFMTLVNKAGSNEVSKLIIQKVILEGLSKQLSLFVSKNISDDSYKNLYGRVFEHIEKLFEYDLKSCSFVTKDFNSYIDSLIRLGDFSGSVMKAEIEPLKKKIENLRKEMSMKPAVDNRLLIKANQNLLSFYEEKFGT
jgi:hypothetical protein